MKTLYVSDLDGTLLNEKSVVSERTKDILNSLVEKHDLLFSIATARTPATAVPLMKDVNLSVPIIVMAGAAMWDFTAHKYVNVCPLHESTVQQVRKVYERHGVHPFIYRNHNGVLHAYHHTRMRTDEERFMNDRIHTPFKRFEVNDTPYSNPAGDDTLIVFSMNRFKVLEAIDEDIRATQIPCHSVCYHDIFNHDDGILEVYAPGVTKAAAVECLKAQTGADRLVVFGDNLNDLEMMQYADYSVAVANAVDEVKRAANEVIGLNTDDSVARRIEKDIEKQ